MSAERPAMPSRFGLLVDPWAIHEPAEHAARPLPAPLRASARDACARAVRRQDDGDVDVRQPRQEVPAAHAGARIRGGVAAATRDRQDRERPHRPVRRRPGARERASAPSEARAVARRGRSGCGDAQRSVIVIRVSATPRSVPPPTLVSVIMPVLDGEAHIADQLAALAGQTYPGEWELVVSDNGCRDRSMDIVRSFEARLPAVTIADARARRGLNHARNTGARAARGDLLAFCDCDDVVSPGWLEAMVAAARQADLVGGRLDAELLNDETVLAWRPKYTMTALVRDHDFMTYAPGGNMAVWTEVAHAIGWDEDFRFGSSDHGFAWHAQMAGYTLAYAHDAVIHQRYASRSAHGAPVLSLRQVRPEALPRVPRPRHATARQQRGDRALEAALTHRARPLGPARRPRRLDPRRVVPRRPHRRQHPRARGLPVNLFVIGSAPNGRIDPAIAERALRELLGSCRSSTPPRSAAGGRRAGARRRRGSPMRPRVSAPSGTRMPTRTASRCSPAAPTHGPATPAPTAVRRSTRLLPAAHGRVGAVAGRALVRGALRRP